MVTIRKVQGSWASGESAALTPALDELRGVIRRIAVKVSDNTGNRTATVAITNDDTAESVWSQATIAENATTVYETQSHKSTRDAAINPKWVAGNYTCTITPSGDPGSGGMTVDVYLYLDDS